MHTAHNANESWKNLHDDAEVCAVPHHLSFELAGETVVLDRSRGAIFEFNEIGTEIWQLLQDPRPVGELTAALLERYDVDEREARAHLLAFLEELERHELLHGAAGHAEPP